MLEIHDKDEKTFLVLGMGHSATSLISKALQEQGVEMCNDDVKYQEDSKFKALNKDILEKAGGHLREPPEDKDIMAVDEKKVKRLLKQKKKKMWGWKDPRTSLTARKYLKYLDNDVYLICCFRKPDKVVDSYYRTYFKVSRESVDKVNRSIIKTIKDFCEL